MPDDLHPTRLEKTLNGMREPRAVKRITFNPSEANPSETLYVHLPKLNEHEVLRFDIDLADGHTNNFLVQNVSQALVDKLVVKFAGHILEETVDHNIYKTFGDLLLPGEKQNNMVPGDSEQGFVQDPPKIRGQENHGRRR